MLRQISFIVLVLAVPFSAWTAPQLPPEKPKGRSLVGTTWTGNSLEKREMILEFLADGNVNVTYNANRVANAGWKQVGDQVYFQLNNSYCEFEGTLKGDRITGQCHNVADNRWDVTLTPVSKDR